MWARLLANYDKYSLFFVGFLIVFKVLLSLAFIKNFERTVVGIVTNIFHWNSLVQREMAESGTERFVMVLQNLMSIFIYTISVILIFTKLLIG